MCESSYIKMQQIDVILSVNQLLSCLQLHIIVAEISLQKIGCFSLVFQKRRFCDAKQPLLPCKTYAFGMRNNRFWRVKALLLIISGLCLVGYDSFLLRFFIPLLYIEYRCREVEEKCYGFLNVKQEDSEGQQLL